MHFKVTADSLDETARFGEKLGEHLRGGEVIQLVGDVGAGKTTFVRSLARGLGSEDPVSSPTFTICNTYQGPIPLHHCDFYRLEDDKLIENELAELISDETVVVMEWAENIRIIKDIDHILITITVEADDKRVFDVVVPPVYNYLTK